MDEPKKDYCASVFILNEDKTKICLIYHKKFQNWIQPGGHLLEGETPTEGAIRKAKEETGLDVTLATGKPFIVEEYNNFLGNIIDYQFLAIAKDSSQKLVKNDSSFDIDWYTLDGLKEIPVFPDIKTKARMFMK